MARIPLGRPQLARLGIVEKQRAALGGTRIAQQHRDVIRAPSEKLRVVGRAAHDGNHVVRAGKRAWGLQFHPEFDHEVSRRYIELRREKILADDNHHLAATLRGQVRREKRRVDLPCSALGVHEQVRRAKHARLRLR